VSKAKITKRADTSREYQP